MHEPWTAPPSKDGRAVMEVSVSQADASGKAEALDD
jgi:hypothetical protein